MPITVDYSPPWLQIENLAVGYGSRCILDGVCFSLRRGEMVGIIGKNGTGKSTLMNALMGLGPWIDGRLAVETGGCPGLLDLPGVAYIPQHRRIVPRLSVNDHLRLASWHSRSGAIEGIDRLLTMPPFVKLRLLRSRKAGLLSGGEQFLLALACAWLNNQRLEALFLDEPSAGLDQDNLGEVHEILSFLKESRDVVVLMVEQNLSTVLQFADRLLLTVATEQGRHSIRELAADEIVAINSFIATDHADTAHRLILQEVGLQ